MSKNTYSEHSVLILSALTLITLWQELDLSQQIHTMFVRWQCPSDIKTGENEWAVKKEPRGHQQWKRPISLLSSSRCMDCASLWDIPKSIYLGPGCLTPGGSQEPLLCPRTSSWCSSGRCVGQYGGRRPRGRCQEARYRHQSRHSGPGWGVDADHQRGWPRADQPVAGCGQVLAEEQTADINLYCVARQVLEEQHLTLLKSPSARILMSSSSAQSWMTLS